MPVLHVLCFFVFTSLSLFLSFLPFTFSLFIFLNFSFPLPFFNLLQCLFSSVVLVIIFLDVSPPFCLLSSLIFFLTCSCQYCPLLFFLTSYFPSLSVLFCSVSFLKSLGKPEISQPNFLGHKVSSMKMLSRQKDLQHKSCALVNFAREGPYARYVNKKCLNQSLVWQRISEAKPVCVSRQCTHYVIRKAKISESRKKQNRLDGLLPKNIMRINPQVKKCTTSEKENTSNSKFRI